MIDVSFPHIIRKSPGKPSRFDTDTELRNFLMSLEETYTVKGLRRILVARFGNGRVPSMSAIHRYLQKNIKAESQGHDQEATP
jgi:hypothetical protein